MTTKFLPLFIFLFLSIANKAQTMNSAPQMADALRNDGKIYVVIAVIAVIFICLMAYLVFIDMKLKKLEKKLK